MKIIKEEYMQNSIIKRVSGGGGQPKHLSAKGFTLAEVLITFKYMR